MKVTRKATTRVEYSISDFVPCCGIMDKAPIGAADNMITLMIGNRPTPIFYCPWCGEKVEVEDRE